MPAAGPDDPTVLIVEDDPFMLRAMNRSLSHAGLNCVACDATSPVAEAIRGETPQVAVVDWHLHARDAADLITTLTDTHPMMPVIIHTGDQRAELRPRFEACGAWAWCGKGDGQLIHRVALALAEHQRRVDRRGYPTMAQIQSTAVRGAMLGAGGNITAAARNLDITPGQLRRLIKRLGEAA